MFLIKSNEQCGCGISTCNKKLPESQKLTNEGGYQRLREKNCDTLRMKLAITQHICGSQKL